MGNKRIELLPNNYYHIYNHGNGNDNIFRRETNYTFFLERYHKYISPIADTFAYCLLPNHFHLVIRTKSTKELMEFYKNKKGKNPNKNPQGFKNLAGLNSRQFSNFFNSYAKAFNKMFDRKGSLFLDNFERNLIDTPEYYKNAIHYVHKNPVHHGFVKDVREWKYTSYESYFTERASRLKREKVIEIFENRENFMEFHKKEIDEKLSIKFEF